MNPLLCPLLILYFSILLHETDKQQEKASRQTHTQETAKLIKKNKKKTQMETRKV
jgi:hypothetical protein